MNISRRSFLSLIVMQRSMPASIPVEVLETFESGGAAIALLVHHADAGSRTAFSQWLRTNSGAVVRVRNGARQEVPATIFRVRMCFGRGLILLRSGIPVLEGATLRVTLAANMRVK